MGPLKLVIQKSRIYNYVTVVSFIWRLRMFFFFNLQEEELNSIQLQEKVDKLAEEKERILNSLVEAE